MDCVLWIRQDAITANDYNPKNVAPPKNGLLELFADRRYSQAWTVK